MDLETAFMDSDDTIDRHSKVADDKSVWSWRKIVESMAEFLCRYPGMCTGRNGCESVVSGKCWIETWLCDVSFVV